MAEQVTDKIERTLQEVPLADKIRSYPPGESQIILKSRTAARSNEVANVWYSVRKKVGDMRYTPPQGVQGRSSTTILVMCAGDHAWRPTASATPRSSSLPTRCRYCAMPDVAKVELFGVQDEKPTSRSRKAACPSWGWT